MYFLIWFLLPLITVIVLYKQSAPSGKKYLKAINAIAFFVFLACTVVAFVVSESSNYKPSNLDGLAYLLGFFLYYYLYISFVLLVWSILHIVIFVRHEKSKANIIRATISIFLLGLIGCTFGAYLYWFETDVVINIFAFFGIHISDPKYTR